MPRSQQRLQATAWERLGDAGRGGNATQLSGEANVEAGFSSAAWQWKADAENAKGLGISLFDEPMGSCAAASIGRASISRATIATTPPESAARPAARSDREDVEQALVIAPALVGIGFAIGAAAGMGLGQAGGAELAVVIQTLGIELLQLQRTLPVAKVTPLGVCCL